jgi:NAD(P)-dependent dehydrogenase (short-subunit alcohol dehydrogenase family)
MIIITGASRGVGNFLINSFIKTSEEPVLGIYNRSKPSDKLELFTKIDVCNMDEINNFVEHRKEELKEITLINCAGITYNSFTHKSESEKWKNVVETNLFGTYNFIRALLPIMREQKFGRIINFSSVVALKPTPGVSAYAASKSALWGLSKSIAIENAKLNININNINLGYSELGMINTVPEEYKNKIISQIPAGELCSSSDILNTVNYLRSTKYITGSSIDLSGGIV